jgi:hypothetical protein
MAARTYQPELLRILRRLQRYLAVWTAFLIPFLDAEEKAALVTLNTAVNLMVSLLSDQPVGP